jgi:deoxyadenosine/deoxycytidine kinase
MKIISIEGNIGSGKSTFISYLRTHHPEIYIVEEPVHEWATVMDNTGVGILEKFYNDQHTYAFPFQILAYVSRFTTFRKLMKLPDIENKIIVTERCLHSDKHIFAKMLHDSGKINDINYQVYCKMFTEFSDDYPIHKLFYVRTDAELCLTRIRERDRNGECEISSEYLFECDKYHEDMVQSYGSSISIVDGNPTRTDAMYETWFDEMVKN